MAAIIPTGQTSAGHQREQQDSSGASQSRTSRVLTAPGSSLITNGPTGAASA